MNQKLIRRVFWPLFIGAVVAVLAAKTAYPSIETSLLDGLIASAYVLAIMYAVTEKNVGARFLRACLLTSTVLYVIYLGTGLAWSLIPWGVALFVVACIFFLRKTLHSRPVPPRTS
jgi:hypothetical protein